MINLFWGLQIWAMLHLENVHWVRFGDNIQILAAIEVTWSVNWAGI